jgi:hypothetical protein
VLLARSTRSPVLIANVKGLNEIVREEAFQTLLRIGPDRSLTFPRFRIFRDDIRREQLLGGLRKAGLGVARRDSR